MEYFSIPRDVVVICVGKSTLARAGAIINVTPIEPGFEGEVVIEIANSTNLPMKIYAEQGIAQFMFFQSDEECETSYADKNGKYQGQTGLTLAKV
jgi:dCTP deaminase